MGLKNRFLKTRPKTWVFMGYKTGFENWFLSLVFLLQYALRKILTFFTCQRRISAIVVSNFYFLPIFAFFFVHTSAKLLSQCMSPNAPHVMSVTPSHGKGSTTVSMVQSLHTTLVTVGDRPQQAAAQHHQIAAERSLPI